MDSLKIEVRTKLRYYVARTSQNYRQAIDDAVDVVAFDAEKRLADIEALNEFGVGDKLQIIHPSGNQDVVEETMLNKKGEPIQEAKGSGYYVRVPVQA